MVLLKPPQLAHVDVSAAVIAVMVVMGWTSANGLVVVMEALVRVALFNLAFKGIVLASRQRPNHPYSIQDVVSAGVASVGAAVGDNVVVSRHPPNHPYFTQDVVGSSVVEVVVEDFVELEVVVSSRHPRIFSNSS